MMDTLEPLAERIDTTSKTKTLLLVDDEPNILSSLSRLFRREGYRLLTAASGPQGLALLRENDIGVIISDQRMPDMIGSEFLAQAKEIRPDTIRIILSGYTELNTVTDAINRGAVYKFLTKPWDDDLLRQHVREAFQQYELREENLRLTNELKITNGVLHKLVGELEQMVAQHTEDLRNSIATLQVGQEILDSLPIGVVGLAEDGLITTANRQAHTILGNPALLANYSTDVLPDSIQPQEDALQSQLVVLNNRPIEARFSKLGSTSKGRGWIIVLIPALS